MVWEVVIAGAVAAVTCTLTYVVRAKRQADANIKTLKRLTEEAQDRERLGLASMRVWPRHANL